MRFVSDPSHGVWAAGAGGSGGVCRGRLTDGRNFGRDTMPLMDHFHPPLSPRRHWESFHVNWAGAIADALNEQLPEGYFAEEHAQIGARVEIDVATFDETSLPSARGTPVAT